MATTPGIPHQDTTPDVCVSPRRSPRIVAKESSSGLIDKKRPAPSSRRKTSSPTKMTSTAATTTTKKKKTSKALLSAAAGGAGATKRQAIYSEDEDYLITSAYVNVSEDPIWGVGQKADTFWTQVFEKYVILSENYPSNNGVEIPVWNKDSIEQRWKKKISKFFDSTNFINKLNFSFHVM
jgi:hypothetical protein